MNRMVTIPILIPEKEYPYNCLDYQNKVICKDEKNIGKIIEHLLKKKEKDADAEIAFLGTPFTSMDEKKQEEILNTIYPYIESGKIARIKIIARPNEINKNILKKYKKYGVKTIELETISSNDGVLYMTKAPYTYNDIKKASKRIRKNGFVLGHNMMIGLPDSTRKDEINTAKLITKLKSKNVRINPIFVIKDTILERMYEKEEYVALDVVPAVERCKELIKIFINKGIDTIRIGIQEAEKTEKVKNKDKIIAGPFHPNFRELVEMELWYDAIEGKIKKLSTKVKEVEVAVNPEDIENVIGIGNKNVLRLKNMYDIDMSVKTDENIEQGKSKIEIIKTYEDFLKE